MTPLAAYILLFLAVGVGFIFVHLLAGKLIRPSKQNPEKETIYECGEPTIGSAWIQFDLRFYVVALLFVIFDVEVAFFFPWAEVFGKANAIRTSAAPQSAEEYRAYSSKVLDLATPRTSISGQTLASGTRTVAQERELWDRLAILSPEELKAFELLRRDDLEILQGLGESRVSDLKKLTAAQIPVLKQQFQALEAVFSRMKEENKKLIQPLKDLTQTASPKQRKMLSNALPDPPGWGMGTRPATEEGQWKSKWGGWIEELEGRAERGERNIRNKSLQELTKLPLSESYLLFDEQPQTLQNLSMALPAEIQTFRATAQRQQQELTQTAQAALKALNATGPEQTGFWQVLTVTWVGELGQLTPEKLEALKQLPPTTLSALKMNLVPGVRSAADNLAWLALVEVLIFFGVLLVGFAYLWKRGDLTWVRSLAAETEETGLAPGQASLQAQLQTTAIK